MHALLSGFWLMTTVEITSSATCPSQEHIRTRLLPLLPPAARKAPDHAELGISPDGTTLRLRLSTADGEFIGARELPVSQDCDELAQKVAVLLASWESNPEGGMPALSPDPKSEQPAHAPWEIQVAGGLGLATVGGLAASGLLASSLGPSQSHWQIRVAFMSETQRKTTFGPAQVAWRHSLASLGPAWRARDRSWLFSGDAGLTIGFANLSGQGYSVNQDAWSMEYGMTAGLRLGRYWGRFGVFGEGRGLYWIRRQHASVKNEPGALSLEPWDVLVGLGAALAFTL